MNTTSITPKEIRHSVIETADEHGVDAVSAVQRGSRRINAEHADSDYDVQFLFKNDPTDYALVGGGRTDSIHAPGNPIDLHGWDIKKFGKLLSDSNPDAIDYCRTRTQYLTSRVAREEFRELAESAVENANLMALYHHWISMAESQYQKYVADEPMGAAINRQFHVANAIASAAYIRETDELPPLDVDEVRESAALPDEVSVVLSGLLEQRRNGDGDTIIEDSVGDIFYEERDRKMEPNDNRTRNPNINAIDNFIRTELTA